MTELESGAATVTGSAGPLDAYVSRPAAPGPLPYLILVHEAFGLTDHIRSQARAFAAQGYDTVAPDLYSGDIDRAALTTQDIEDSFAVSAAADMEVALASLPDDRRVPVRRAVTWRNTTRQFVPRYVDDLAAIAAERARQNGGFVGVVGWCMGGYLAGLLAAQGADVSATVIYYGGAPPLDTVNRIRGPVLGHYAGEDIGITSAVPEFAAAMQGAGRPFEYHVYDGARHGFNNDDRFTYRADCASLAMARTLAFLARTSTSA
ncbi:MAG TPA: dienelactone hydrolase family protein [Acidimicrobiales bacterium]|nr:dienelactone hydrolase family protein [Acidimicrobiales bacterium]